MVRSNNWRERRKKKRWKKGSGEKGERERRGIEAEIRGGKWREIEQEKQKNMDEKTEGEEKQ